MDDEQWGNIFTPDSSISEAGCSSAGMQVSPDWCPGDPQCEEDPDLQYMLPQAPQNSPPECGAVGYQQECGAVGYQQQCPVQERIQDELSKLQGLRQQIGSLRPQDECAGRPQDECAGGACPRTSRETGAIPKTSTGAIPKASRGNIPRTTSGVPSQAGDGYYFSEHPAECDSSSPEFMTPPPEERRRRPPRPGRTRFYRADSAENSRSRSPVAAPDSRRRWAGPRQLFTEAAPPPPPLPSPPVPFEPPPPGPDRPKRGTFQWQCDRVLRMLQGQLTDARSIGGRSEPQSPESMPPSPGDSAYYDPTPPESGCSAGGSGYTTSDWDTGSPMYSLPSTDSGASTPLCTPDDMSPLPLPEHPRDTNIVLPNIETFLRMIDYYSNSFLEDRRMRMIEIQNLTQCLAQQPREQHSSTIGNLYVLLRRMQRMLPIIMDQAEEIVGYLRTVHEAGTHRHDPRPNINNLHILCNHPVDPYLSQENYLQIIMKLIRYYELLHRWCNQESNYIDEMRDKVEYLMCGPEYLETQVPALLAGFPEHLESIDDMKERIDDIQLFVDRFVCLWRESGCDELNKPYDDDMLKRFPFFPDLTLPEIEDGVAPGYPMPEPLPEEQFQPEPSPQEQLQLEPSPQEQFEPAPARTQHVYPPGQGLPNQPCPQHSYPPQQGLPTQQGQQYIYPPELGLPGPSWKGPEPFPDQGLQCQPSQQHSYPTRQGPPSQSDRQYIHPPELGLPGPSSLQPIPEQGLPCPSGARTSKIPVRRPPPRTQSGMQASRPQCGAQASGPRSGTQPSRTQARSQASRPRSNMQASRSQCGAQAPRPRPGAQAQRTQSGLQASRPRSNMQASSSQCGAQAPRPRPGAQAQRTQSGLQASRPRSNMQASRPQSGAQASRSQCGAQASRTQCGAQASRPKCDMQASRSQGGQQTCRPPAQAGAGCQRPRARAATRQQRQSGEQLRECPSAPYLQPSEDQICDSTGGAAGPSGFQSEATNCQPLECVIESFNEMEGAAICEFKMVSEEKEKLLKSLKAMKYSNEVPDEKEPGKKDPDKKDKKKPWEKEPEKKDPKKKGDKDDDEDH